MKIAYDLLFDFSMFLSDKFMTLASWADSQLTKIEEKQDGQKQVKEVIQASNEMSISSWCEKQLKEAMHPSKKNEPRVQLFGGPLDGAIVPLQDQNDHDAIFCDFVTKRCYSYHYHSRDGVYRYDREVGSLGMPEKK